MADTPLSIYRARLAELLKSIEAGETELAGIHAKLSDEIIAKLHAMPANTNMDAARLKTLFDAEFAKTLPKRVRVLRGNIEAGAKAGPKAARQTFRAVLGDEVTASHVRSTAKALREAGERIAGRVTVDGVSLGRRMRRVDAEVAQEMAGAVQDGIRSRKGILGAARKIEKLDPRSAELPQYLQELEAAARAGKMDDVRALAKIYVKRIARMGEAQVDGTFLASKYSLKSATKKFVADMQTASGKGIDKVVARYVKDKLAFRANVIARSESVEAMRQSYVAQAAKKPGVYAFRWRLSGRHAAHDHGGSREDVCDILAAQNAYGLGPGRYPAAHVPKLPHPSCICTVTAELDRRHFERAESERGKVPDDLRDDKSPDAVGWLKQNDATAARILGPTRHALLKEGRNVLTPSGAPALVRDLLGHAKAAE
jgi:hypothetical protein